MNLIELNNMDQKVINNFICDTLKKNNKKLPFLSKKEYWDMIFKVISRHNLSSCFYYVLKNKFNLDEVPDSFLEDLQKQYYTVAAYNTRLFHELAQILKAFKQNRIQVILLKGAYLATQVYETQSLRPMYDLDLLIKKGQINKAIEVFKDLGYSLGKNYSQEALDDTQIHLPVFVKTGKNVNVPNILVELHWSILRPKMNRSLDIDKVWERAEPILFNGLNALALSPEDNLHHFAIHTVFDDFLGNGMLPLVDIAKLIENKKDEISWSKLYDISISSGTERYCFLALFLSKELLGANVSQSFLDKFKSERPSVGILKYAEDRILKPNSGKDAQADFIGRTLGKGFSLEHGSLMKKIFPNKADISEIYGVNPKSLKLLLYYPVRWWDVFVRYIAVFIQLLLGDTKLKSAAKRGSQSRELTDWLSS